MNWRIENRDLEDCQNVYCRGATPRRRRRRRRRASFGAESREALNLNGL